MWADTIVTYIHFICVFSLFSVLIAEVIVLKPKMWKEEIALFVKIDAWYGVISILVLGSGFLRVYYFGKGPNYYFDNGIFILKLSLFIVIGLLSIYPSLKFFKLKKKAQESTVINNYQILKRIIITEILILVLIPLMAVLMAKGVDL